MILDFAKLPKIRRESYMEYEYIAEMDGGTKILFNDTSATYNHLVALEVGDKLLRFHLIDAEPTDTIVGDDYLLYPEVLPDVDLYYNLSAGQLKEDLVINSVQAQHEFTFLLETNNVTASLQPDNSITYQNAEGNIVWTIDAPFATDANGNPVETYLDFNDSQYTVGVLPTADAIYPIKLDPTVTFPAGSGGFIISTKYSTDSSDSFRYSIGRGDGAQVISSLTVYNQRYYYATSGSTEYTSYTSNGTYATTYYQFYDKRGSAIGANTPLVVNNATECLATISIPAGAYTINFTGTARSPVSLKFSRNELTIVSLETTSASSNWAVGEKSRTVTPAGASYTCSLPRVNFSQNQETTIPITDTYEAPRDSTYVAGTYNVGNYRDGYGFVKNCYIDLYDTANTLISTTSIPYLATSGTRTTSLTVPANIRKIVIRGGKYRGGSIESSAKVTLSIPATSTDYGTFNYVYTLDSDATDQTISPGFCPLLPQWGYDTYVRYGNDSTASHVKTSTITAAAGTQVSIKICLLGDESGYVTDTYNVCLLGSSNTPVILNVDTSRKTKQATSSATDTARSVCADKNALIDSIRYISADISTLADISRNVVTSLELAADTKRPVETFISAAIDSERFVIVSDNTNLDTYRSLAANQLVAVDSTRIALVNDMTLADTNRYLAVMYSANGFVDTLRKVIKCSELTADTERGINVSVFVNADTKRVIGQALQGLAILDTVRTVIKGISQKSDLTRRILSASSALVDTKRRPATQNVSTSDLVRKTGLSAQVNADTGRKTIAYNLVKLDTSRKTMNIIHVLYDTKRVTGERLLLLIDTKRKIGDGVWPYAKHCELNIQIQGKQITVLSYQD